jgi:lipopolysaccharide transport system ATP-binding protein
MDQLERAIFTSEIQLKDFVKVDGNQDFIVKLPYKTLVPNDYRIHVAFHVPNLEIINNLENVVNFNIEETGSNFHKYAGKDYGCVVLDNEWCLKDSEF